MPSLICAGELSLVHVAAQSLLHYRYFSFRLVFWPLFPQKWQNIIITDSSHFFYISFISFIEHELPLKSSYFSTIFRYFRWWLFFLVYLKYYLLDISLFLSAYKLHYAASFAIFLCFALWSRQLFVQLLLLPHCLISLPSLSKLAWLMQFLSIFLISARHRKFLSFSRPEASYIIFYFYRFSTS